MGKATVTWLQKLQFVGTDSSKHSVVIASPDEDNGVGMKPAELLLVALASCTAYDVVNILRKKQKRLVHLQVEIEGTQQATPPWPFTQIHMVYTVVGEDLTERDVAKAIALSHEKYCSVSATLRPAVAITHAHRVLTPQEFAGR